MMSAGSIVNLSEAKGSVLHYVGANFAGQGLDGS